MLVLEVDNHVTSVVSGKLSTELYQELKRVLGYKSDNVKWIKKQMVDKAPMNQKASMQKRMEEWDGYFSTVCYSKGRCKCFEQKDCTHFPTGLLRKCIDFFRRFGIPYNLVDVRRPVYKSKTLETSPAMETRPYQVDAKNKACEVKRGIIRCATGGGKTSIAASIIAELGVAPFIFYVTSCDLLVQAKRELQKFILENGKNIEVGSVGGGEKDIKDVTVMTVQTAVRALGGKYEKFDDEDSDKDETDIDTMKADICDLIKSAKGIICDEVQHWASATCQIISDASKDAYYRYGLSATPWRDMGDDVLIDACFGSKIVDISASFLIERNYLVAPEIYFIKMGNTTGTKYKTYAKIYKQAVQENITRNTYISKIALKMQDEGRLPLVLVKQIAHGKALQQMIPGSDFLHGKISKEKRMERIDQMSKRECGITIASSIFDEGIDVRPLDTLILAGSGKSATRALQRIGRIIRPYTDENGKSKTLPIVVDFYDDVKYLKEHSDKRLSIYSTEEKFKIKHLKI